MNLHLAKFHAACEEYIGIYEVFFEISVPEILGIILLIYQNSLIVYLKYHEIIKVMLNINDTTLLGGGAMVG